MRAKHQIVTLETFDGICTDANMLEEVWNCRLKKHFPHYQVKCVEMKK